MKFTFKGRFSLRAPEELTSQIDVTDKPIYISLITHRQSAVICDKNNNLYYKMVESLR